jgi:hypothetical protein
MVDVSIFLSKIVCRCSELLCGNGETGGASLQDVLGQQQERSLCTRGPSARCSKFGMLLQDDAATVDLKKYVMNTEGHPFPILFANQNVKLTKLVD